MMIYIRRNIYGQYIATDKDGHIYQEVGEHDSRKAALAACTKLWPLDSQWRGRVTGGNYHIVAEGERDIGSPVKLGQKMRQTGIWLPMDMMDWLKAQPGTMSETIRRLVKQAMDDQKETP